ncbi:MAG: RNA polymerase sigma factor [Holophagales bacterium]|nr:RNA polymerase sigma factor [Holophagales bacterium]
MTNKPIVLAAPTDSPYHSPEVDLWVKAAQAGDQIAFTRLMGLFQKDVYGKAFSILRNHQDADDVVQETFLRVYRALPGFRGESSFRTWLITIATRQSLNFLDRNRINYENIEDIAFSTPHPALRTEDNQMTAYLDQESRRLMREAFPKLPKRQKEALALRLKHDLKYDQIAVEMDTTVGSVKAHIFHAIKNLARHVKEGKL